MNSPIMMITKPALSAIAVGLHGLAEALQYAADNAVLIPLNAGTKSVATDGAATLSIAMTEGGISNGDNAQRSVSPPPGIDLAEIRALLSERCESGKEDAVRALIASFGADKLTQVDQRHYPALLQAAQALAKAKEGKA